MNRAQFMEQLEKLLSDISETERLEALDYYNGYFDDAGEENEAAVIRELGSPGKVAAIIKADLKESNDDYAEYTERGYEDTRTREERQMPDACHNGSRKDTKERAFGRARAGADHKEDGAGEDSRGNGYGSEREERARRRAERGYHPKERKNNAGVILVLILLVFLSPFLCGAAGGILGIVITVALLPFILTFAAGVCTAAFLVSGVACAAAGIGLCFGHPAAGILTLGVGFILIAVALLFLIALIWTAGKLLPWLLNKFADTCHNILHRERKDGERA